MGFGPGDADAIDFAAELANLYLETSLGNYLIMRDALDRLGPGKLIFGSEFPLGHPRAELENVRLLDPSAHEAILAGNILRLLGVTS
jgi:predicted TIM-barrel fold metal-dependent hydrolase